MSSSEENFGVRTITELKEEDAKTRRRTEYNKLWEKLEDGIKRIYEHEESLNPTRLMKYHTYVYNYCNMDQPNPQMFYDSSQRLYCLLEDYLDELVSGISDFVHYIPKRKFVKYYLEEWQKYKVASEALNQICYCLNTTWVKQEQENVCKSYDVFEIYKNAMVIWEIYMFAPSNLVTDTYAEVVKLIERKRNGKCAKFHLVSDVVNSLIELGKITKGPCTEQYLCLYQKFLETPILKNTEAYYKQKSVNFLKTKSAVEYWKFTERRLRKERKFAQAYLHASSVDRLIATCEQELIHNHLEVFQCVFQNLLETDNDSDMRCLCSLVARTTDGYAKLKDTWETHIFNQCMKVKCSEVALCDPYLYVQIIVGILRKHQTLITSTFNYDSGFVDALNRAFVQFINSDGAEEARSIPMVLAKYFDTLLKRCLQTPKAVDLDDAFNQLMVIFNCIVDKDSFQQFSSKMLAKRLSKYMAANSGVKASITSKLATAFSYEYTDLLRCLLQDILFSNILNGQYKQFIKDVPGANFDVNVLQLSTKLCEPNLTKLNVELRLPLQIEQCVTQYNYILDIYGEQRPKRKLIWLYGMCHGELTTNCFQTQYTLHVSTFQITVLLQFNEKKSWTIHQLYENTGLDYDTLIRTLRVLLKTNLLQSSDNESTLQPTSTVNLNDKFHNADPSINLNDPKLCTQQKEALLKQANDRNRFVIQAAIVTIMKQGKTLIHSDLVAKVLNKLSTRFKPDVRLIKKSIDLLIDKEYLQRQEGQLDVYSYVE